MRSRKRLLTLHVAVATMEATSCQRDEFKQAVVEQAANYAKKLMTAIASAQPAKLQTSQNRFLMAIEDKLETTGGTVSYVPTAGL